MEIFAYVVYYSGGLFSWLAVEAESPQDAAKQIVVTLDISDLPMDNSINADKHRIICVVRDNGDKVWERKTAKV